MVRKQFDPYPTENSSSHKKCVLWGKSDTLYLQQSTNSVCVEEIIRLGGCFFKIGAKIIEMSQPLDVGPFFKILKYLGRSCISIGSSSAMEMKVDILFNKMSKNKQVVLATCRLNAVKYCIVTTPKMITKVFKGRVITKAFIDSGVLDGKN